VVTAVPTAFDSGAHVAADSLRRSDSATPVAAGSLRRSDSATPVAAGSPRRTDAAPSREVLNAARALREMPPYARQREIDSGRYSHFSPDQRAQLRNLVQ
jgi:hypothetical protein